MRSPRELVALGALDHVSRAALAKGAPPAQQPPPLFVSLFPKTAGAVPSSSVPALAASSTQAGFAALLYEDKRGWTSRRQCAQELQPEQNCAQHTQANRQIQTGTDADTANTDTPNHADTDRQRRARTFQTKTHTAQVQAFIRASTTHGRPELEAVPTCVTVSSVATFLAACAKNGEGVSA